MGEPEMARDREQQWGVHLGGKYDTYLGLPLKSIEENHQVGAFFVKPDGAITSFRDPNLSYDVGNTFTAIGAKAGYVLNIHDGIVGAPKAYIISEVRDDELLVNGNAPFPEASDEFDDQTTNAVKYSIGWAAPSFDNIELEPGVNKRTAAQSTTDSSALWGTSRRTRQAGRVTLSGRPVQDIELVEITNPPAALGPIIDPSSRTVIFSQRVNQEPSASADFYGNQYQFIVDNPLEAQSGRAVNSIVVGYSPVNDMFDGLNMRVKYKTLDGFQSADSYVRGRFNRILAADHLVRGRFSVWISITIPYRNRTNTSLTLDTDAAADTVASFINNFDFSDTLDSSDISTILRVEYPVIGAVFPFNIEYVLESPDGQRIFFTTEDVVSIFPTENNGVVFDENESNLRVPSALQNKGITSIATDSQLLTYLDYLGVTDRTVVYRCDSNDIALYLRG
jgi:hypothetical protein